MCVCTCLISHMRDQVSNVYFPAAAVVSFLHWNCAISSIEHKMPDATRIKFPSECSYFLRISISFWLLHCKPTVVIQQLVLVTNSQNSKFDKNILQVQSMHGWVSDKPTEADIGLLLDRFSTDLCCVACVRCKTAKITELWQLINATGNLSRMKWNNSVNCWVFVIGRNILRNMHYRSCSIF